MATKSTQIEISDIQICGCQESVSVVDVMIRLISNMCDRELVDKMDEKWLTKLYPLFCNGQIK